MKKYQSQISFSLILLFLFQILWPANLLAQAARPANDTLSLPSGTSDPGLIYQVHILGDVNLPGTYRVAASTRLTEALKLAGGFTANGSERRIQIRKANKITHTYDLLSYRLQGRLEDNPYLMDNDVVFVPLRSKVVEIKGTVNRPGIYELKNEKSAFDLIQLGGGFTQGLAKSEPLRVIRYNDKGEREILEIANNPSELKKFHLEDADVLVSSHLFTTQNTFDYKIRKFPKDNYTVPSFDDRVYVFGGVKSPGAFPFTPNLVLRNYLILAGGPTKLAKKNFKIADAAGKVRKSKLDSDEVINPGDVIYIPEKTFTPEGWVSFVMGLASFGLSTTSTVLALTRN